MGPKQEHPTDERVAHILRRIKSLGEHVRTNNDANDLTDMHGMYKALRAEIHLCAVTMARTAKYSEGTDTRSRAEIARCLGMTRGGFQKWLNTGA